MRVITFSKVFPVKHPKAGMPTEFVASILNRTKKHTIRAGNRWKEGDMFSGRVWSDKPYRSKQIEFVEAEILKVWPIKMELFNGQWYASTHTPHKEYDQLLSIGELAKNDGLSYEDFINWFAVHPKIKADGFIGQILCWDPEINY